MVVTFSTAAAVAVIALALMLSMDTIVTTPLATAVTVAADGAAVALASPRVKEIHGRLY